MSLIDDNFTFRLRVELLPDFVEAPEAENLVIIRFTDLDNDGRGFLSQCKTDGSDIYFTSDKEGNNRVPVWIQDFSPTASFPFTFPGYAYVNQGLLSNLTSTFIYAWCGNPLATTPLPTDPFGQYAVFNSTYQDYFVFDEATGPFASANGSSVTWDVSGGSTRPVITTPFLYDTGLDFNGSTDRLECSGSGSPLVTSSFHIGFWILTTQQGNVLGNQWWQHPAIVDGEVSGVTDDWGISIGKSGQIAFGIGNPDTTLFSVTAVGDGVAHYVGADWDSVTGAVYISIDGVITATATLTTGDRDSVNCFIGANFQNNQNFDGTIGQLSIINQSLPATGGGIPNRDRIQFQMGVNNDANTNYLPSVYVQTPNYSDDLVNAQVTAMGFLEIKNPSETRIPVAVIIQSSTADVAPNTASPQRLSMAYCTGDTQRMLGHHNQNGANSSGFAAGSGSVIYSQIDNSFAFYVQASFEKWIPGGMGISVNTFNGIVGVQALFIYETPAYTEFALATTGTAVFTGCPFQPNHLYNLWFRNEFNTGRVGTKYSFGFCDENLNQACGSFSSESGVNDLTTIIHNDKIVGEISDAGDVIGSLEVTAYNSDGADFTISGSLNEGFGILFPLFLELPPGHGFVGVDTNQSVLGEHLIDTTFEPQSLMTISSPVDSFGIANRNNGKANTFSQSMHNNLGDSFTLSFSTEANGPGQLNTANRSSIGLTTVAEDNSILSQADFVGTQINGMLFDWTLADPDKTLIIFSAMRITGPGTPLVECIHQASIQTEETVPATIQKEVISPGLIQKEIILKQVITPC